ncbi:MAG: Lipoyl synthase [Phycisphaerae bacterium]|nr:Lipoyl synthase [Phycisphaerae bacterium]
MQIRLDVLNNHPEHRRFDGRRRLPPWLRKRLPLGAAMTQTSQLLHGLHLATVCEDAKCPNLPECWSKRTATFMIMGQRCTRRCWYCSVETGRPEPLEADEPERLAEAAASMNLRHVVITSVARDDLADEGAGHFARCVQAVRRLLPTAFTETLTPDFHARSECIARVLDSGVTIFNHNIETVARMQPVIRPQGRYDRSLEVLRLAKERLASHPAEGGRRFTKSGLMVGLGESFDEVLVCLRDLRAAGCDILTVGQYLQPTPQHAPVVKYWEPAEFDAIASAARGMGFVSVASGPFVRSSYNAAEVYEQATA